MESEKKHISDEEIDTIIDIWQQEKVSRLIAIFSDTNEKEPKLTGDSTLKETADYFNEWEKFSSDYNRLRNAPDYETALMLFIKKIEKCVYGNDISTNSSSSVIPLIYQKTTQGDQDTPIKIFAPWLLTETADWSSPDDESIEDYIDELSQKALTDIAKGVVYAYKLPELRKELATINNQPIEQEPEVFVKFSSAGEKYALLHRLGLIDFLKSNYPDLNNTKIALLLAYITDTKNSKSFENLISQHSNREHEHYPFKEKNMVKTDNIFHQVGIALKNKKQ